MLRANILSTVHGLGLPVDAYSEARRALELATIMGSGRFASRARRLLAGLAAELNRPDEARQLLESAAPGEAQDRIVRVADAILVAIASGDLDAAVAASRVLDERPWPHAARRLVADYAVEALLAADDFDAAQRAGARGVGELPKPDPYQLTIEGRLALAAGKVQTAIENLTEAIAIFHRAGYVHREGRARRVLAEAIAGTGDFASAETELHAALGSARTRGAALEARIVRDLLVRLDLPTDLCSPDQVRRALESLHDESALRQSPLMHLQVLQAQGTLRALLSSRIDELAKAPTRDGEAGRVLRDYYVRRVGNQELVAERLHLSRPTFYRRLHRGWSLLAEHLGPLRDPPRRG
jgi:tetratricopeptide (TPR) repeat protein